MKLIISISTCFLLILMLSCKGKKNENKETITKNDNINLGQEQLEDLSKIALVDCIKKGIYYMEEVDVSTYDSINTQYFHKVIDYIDTTAISIENELVKLNYIIESDGSMFYDNEQLDSIIIVAHDLKKQLITYQKETIGYVFVHTFLNKGDTISAIILANADCSKSEAIKIKTITDIEPNLFKQKIKNIEN